MRLLNTSTLLLEEFMTNPPPYAILSHTWETEKVLFKDVENGTAHQKKGYEKVTECCELAASEGYKYAWIDTCCIDKSSSAELSEAINSMFEWYRQSAVCYVYLDTDIEREYLTAEDLRRGRWIHRGWTLQELIAPSHVFIYTKYWQFCGSRHDLARQLHEVTCIALDVLQRRDMIALDLSRFSIAMRMAWASKRETTRPEDIAYCLLGIFDVHLPLLYGEGGEKAFVRLQEEIMRTSMDLSFLAWDAPFFDRHDLEMQFRLDNYDLIAASGIAKSPSYFSSRHRIVKLPSRVEPFRMTNKGLHVSLPFLEEPRNKDCFVVLPNCRFENDYNGPIGVRMVPNWTDDPDVTYRFASFKEEPLLCTVPKELLQQAQVKMLYIALKDVPLHLDPDLGVW